jgi:hypothetical protein
MDGADGWNRAAQGAQCATPTPPASTGRQVELNIDIASGFD